MTSTPTAKDRAQDAASTASDEGRHVAGVAQQEAGNVTSEAVAQARHVMDQAMTQVSAQSQEQKDRLAGTLRTFGDDLESMTAQANPGLAADLSRQVSGYARSIGDHLQSREPGELLDDVRRFARRRPGTFLLGALAAGVVVGRLVRGAADGTAGAQAVQDSQGADGLSTNGTPITPSTTSAAPAPPASPGAPSGAPFVPDPREIHDTHGHETGAPMAPSSSYPLGGSEDLR